MVNNQVRREESAFPSSLKASIKAPFSIKGLIWRPYLPDITYQFWSGFKSLSPRPPAGWGRFCPLRGPHQLERLDLTDRFLHISPHRWGQYFKCLNHPIGINDKPSSRLDPPSSSYTPYALSTLPPASDSIVKGMPPATILDSSISFHILWTNTLSTLIDNTSTPNFCNSACFSATAESSVAQTKVKSPG